MELKSLAFKNNDNIPKKYTCDGENINPPLEISNIPEGAKSLALICDDPDAPGGDWVHWLVWNIDPSVAFIGENELPRGVMQGKTDFGTSKYGGPCPPSGTHRYQFKLYALDTILNLPQESVKSELESAMNNHFIERCTLIGLYKRN